MDWPGAIRIYLLTGADFSATFFAELFPFCIWLKRKEGFSRRLFISIISIILSSAVLFGGPIIVIWLHLLYQWEFLYELTENVCFVAAYALMFFVFLFFLVYLFEENKGWLIMDLIVAYAIKQISEYCFYFLSALIHLQSIFPVDDFRYLLIRYSFFTAFFIATLLFQLKRRMNNHPQVPLRTIVMISALLLVPSIVINQITFGIQNESLLLYLSTLTFGIIDCILIIYIRYFFIDKLAFAQEMSTKEKIWKDREKQLMSSKENAELISIKYHDLKHQIANLKASRFDDNKMIAEIDEAINIYDSVVTTGNDTLDSVLTDKKIFCERNGIRLSCIADGKLLSFMSSTDIVSLFSNVLENSIEAVTQLNSEKSISLNVSEFKGFVSVSCANPFKGEIIFDKGLPETSKKDKDMHGYGMKSMNLLAKKYGGSMEITVENNIFSIAFLFPKPSNQNQAAI